jgi:hypothetical protein
MNTKKIHIAVEKNIKIYYELENVEANGATNHL